MALRTVGDDAEQAATALASRFAGASVVRVVSSPLERCIETATPLAEAVGLQVVVDDDLLECAYGDWTGRKLADLAKDRAEHLRATA